MATRVFLGLMAGVWLPYGIYCFFVPGSLEGNAGVVAASATGTTELRAMYGGLQVGVGVLALAALRGLVAARSVVVAIAVLVAGLASTRAIAAIDGGDASGYTLGALAFEVALVAGALLVLRRDARGTAAAA